MKNHWIKEREVKKKNKFFAAHEVAVQVFYATTMLNPPKKVKVTTNP